MRVTITDPLESTGSSSRAGVRSMEDGTTNGSNQNSASISANDFLTLLVTEMQNQDPTASVDPNEYVNQLVNVNSLQQLISINQTLSGALSTSATKPSVQPANIGKSLAEAAPGNIPTNQESFGVKAQTHSAEPAFHGIERRKVASPAATPPETRALASAPSSDR